MCYPQDFTEAVRFIFATQKCWTSAQSRNVNERSFAQQLQWQKLAASQPYPI
jgi:hypothetical protein